MSLIFSGKELFKAGSAERFKQLGESPALRQRIDSCLQSAMRFRQLIGAGRPQAAPAFVRNPDAWFGENIREAAFQLRKLRELFDRL